MLSARVRLFGCDATTRRIAESGAAMGLGAGLAALLGCADLLWNGAANAVVATEQSSPDATRPDRKALRCHPTILAGAVGVPVILSREATWASS